MESNDFLQKLAQKAKKKLNKTADEEKKNKREIEASYEFISSTRENEKLKLKKKVQKLLASNKDCLNPIARLIDHEVYDTLSEGQKECYILKLAADYRDICEKL